MPARFHKAMNLSSKSSFPPRSLIAAGIAVFIVVCGLLSLGVWQLQRLAWKNDLIARVDARVHAVPVPAPGPDQWPDISRENDEYRRVSVSGTFQHDRETLVQAVTELGAGFWVLTPLVDDRGDAILINRGFVPSDRRLPESRAAGQIDGAVTVTGLIRITEPKGAFLRDNDPVADKWYARDVAAIAEARDLGDTAPYFIDADGTPNPGDYPRGGLTRISFPNTHLIYALTWFSMAVIAAAMFIGFYRHSRREYQRRLDNRR